MIVTIVDDRDGDDDDEYVYVIFLAPAVVWRHPQHQI